MSHIKNYYREIVLIREFESLLLSHFKGGMLRGTVHTSIGQEIVAVASMKFVQKNDYVFFT